MKQNIFNYNLIIRKHNATSSHRNIHNNYILINSLLLFCCCCCAAVICTHPQLLRQFFAPYNIKATKYWFHTVTKLMPVNIHTAHTTFEGYAESSSIIPKQKVSCRKQRNKSIRIGFQSKCVYRLFHTEISSTRFYWIPKLVHLFFMGNSCKKCFLLVFPDPELILIKKMLI